MRAEIRFDRSLRQHLRRWTILDKKVRHNAVPLGTYRAEVDALVLWLKTRAQWIDSQR